MTMGLLIRGAERTFYGELAAGVQRETDRLDADLLIAAAGDDERHQVRAVRTLLGHGVGGILIASGRASEEAVDYAASFVPTVTIALGLVRPGFDAVNIDPKSEADLADAVAAAGHRHVVVTASQNRLAYTLHARTANYLTRLVLAGVRTTILPDRGEDDAEVRTALRAALDDGATAVMTGDDATAVRVLEYLAEWRIDCPGRVSVTGFDGVGVYRSPLIGLTSVTQPVAELARSAVALMAQRLEGDTRPACDVRVPGILREGRTLGPAPA
jgi:LacI family transcriptional regulator